MTDVAPILLPHAEPPRRDRRIIATLAASVVLHLLVLGFVLLPREPRPEPTEPQSIAVELVPPSEVSSVELPASSDQPSSQPPSSDEPSSEASSSQASMAPSAPSSAPSSTQPSSAEAPSSQAAASELASSAEAPSSIQPSAASSTPPPPSESSNLPPSGVSSAEPSSSKEVASASSAASAPQVPPARPVVIPVGQGASSEQEASADDASASASEGASDASSAEPSSAPDAASEQVLAANGAEASDGVDQGASSGISSEEVATLADGPPPPAQDLLHAAKRFYLADMLDQAALAKARDALKKLPPEKRLAQTCNIEAIGQIGNAGKGFAPDAMVANAFAAPTVDGVNYTVSNGAFRSGKKWYGIAYECTLNKAMTAVTAFKFHIGGDVTDAMVARYGKG